MSSAFSSPSLANHPGLDEWVSVGEDGRIAIHTGKVDIGQRISTALAIVAAEELDIDMSRIDIIRTVTGDAPDEGITSGSNSMMESGSAVRLASATARAHLLTRAADLLGVEGNALEIDDGLIQSRETNRSVTFGELQGGKPFGIDVDPDADVKPPGDHRLVGQRISPLGLADIVAGNYTFLQDMKMPGMLHARVVRPPHYHARLSGVDEAVAGRLREGGIRIVRDGSYLAVAGEDEYAVIRAAERLFAACDWDMAGGIPQADLFDSITGNERISLPVENDGVPQDKPVPPLEEPAGAAHTLSARYDKPYHTHGSIGPSAGIALWRDDGLQVWSHSQGVYFLRSAISEAFGLEEDTVRIEHVPGAGCYGHNGADDAAFDAALIARALPGKPILLKWSREEEHSWAPYATAMSLKLQASLDADGRVMAWSHESYGDTFNMRPRSGPNMAGAARLLSSRFMENPPPPFVPQPAIMRHMGLHRNLDPLYAFPNKRLVKNLVRDLPLRTSALRTLGAFGNVFALESFMDELAEAAGVDPITFRLNHLEDPRGREVIETLARHADPTPAADGRGRGIGFAQYKNLKAYAAVYVELEVNDAAEIVLHRAVLVGDAGEIVDRDGLTAQFDGGFLQAASWTIHEQVTWDSNGITSRDWDGYPILRFDNVPEIETVLIERPGVAFLGAGEAVSGPTGAAIGNAVYNATGLRLRRMPFTPDAIRAAALEV